MLCRLPSGGCIERQKYIHFTFNGCGYLGLEGDTLASALLANRVRLGNRRWTFNRAPAGFGLGGEAPYASAQVFDGVSGASNVRMNELALFEGLTAKSVDPQPRVDLETPGVASTSSGFIPERLGDKAFLASRKVWNYFERHLFNASRLQEPPNPADFVPDERHSTTCDVLVVGGGIAGLSAALAAGSSGARVLCVDEQVELGGWLLASAEEVDGLPATVWVANAIERLRAMPAVTLLPRTTVCEYSERNQLMLSERRIELLSAGISRVRKCLWDVRAKQVVLATGSHERLLVFPKNDLPGVMLASAVSMYIRRFAVLPGSEAVVYTNNDAGYDAAFALKAAGAHVKVIDARALPGGPVTARAKALRSKSVV